MLATPEAKTPAPNYTAIKEKQQTAWGSGDYSQVGVTLQITGESLCEAMDIRAGSTVLDVAAGNGNVTLAAARRFANVVSTDYVQSLLDRSMARANTEGLTNIEYQIADAESLPFTADSFDNVVSTFGVMFAPNQIMAAGELNRVCRPGGRIGMANWTPEGFIGQLFKVIGSHVAPPAGVQSPARWGTESFLSEQFSTARDIQINKTHYNFRYQSVDHWVDVFSNYYGPVHKALEALGDQRGALESDIRELINRTNIATDGTVVIPSEYLEVVVQV